MPWSKCTKCHHETYRETCDWCGAPTKPLEKEISWNLYEILKKLKGD